jgi:hypothetical protein
MICAGMNAVNSTMHRRSGSTDAHLSPARTAGGMRVQCGIHLAMRPVRIRRRDRRPVPVERIRSASLAVMPSTAAAISSARARSFASDTLPSGVVTESVNGMSIPARSRGSKSRLAVGLIENSQSAPGVPAPPGRGLRFGVGPCPGERLDACRHHGEAGGLSQER